MTVRASFSGLLPWKTLRLSENQQTETKKIVPVDWSFRFFPDHRIHKAPTLEQNWWLPESMHVHAFSARVNSPRHTEHCAASCTLSKSDLGTVEEKSCLMVAVWNPSPCATGSTDGDRDGSETAVSSDLFSDEELIGNYFYFLECSFK